MFDIIKWLATAVLIVGSAVNGLGIYPAGPAILCAGGVLWLVVSVHMRDRALIVTNAVMILAGGIPLVLNLWF